MLMETVLKYYLEQDYNCAESLSRGANEYYNLGLNEGALLSLGGFGGGCCSGRLCGACAGCVAAISSKYMHKRAHVEERARSRVKEFMDAFIETLGSDQCEELKNLYYDDSLECCKCVKTVEMAAGVLEEKMAQYMAQDEALSMAERACE